MSVILAFAFTVGNDLSLRIADSYLSSLTLLILCDDDVNEPIRFTTADSYLHAGARFASFACRHQRG